MSNSNNIQRIRIPDAFRDVLLKFSIAYLLEQPSDVIEYAVEYFTNLQRNRNHQSRPINNNNQHQESTLASSNQEKNESPTVHQIYLSRRKSVFAEAYNPEKDTEGDIDDEIISKTDEQRKQLIKSFKKIFLFRSLDADQMNQVINLMFEKNVKPNEFVIRQGENGDNFYIIESGRYKVYVDNKNVHTYDNEGSFGELALLHNMPRAATIKAETKGKLWVMNRKTFRRIVLKSAFQKRKMYESLLKSVPMLKTLKNNERMNLVDALIPKIYNKGGKIIGQGDPADGMYFIEDGQVSIKVKENNKITEIAVLKKGQYFGELALITYKPRAASAYAITNKVKLAFLDTEAFERLLGPCMEIMKRNIDDYETQLIQTFGSKSKITPLR